MLDRTIIVAIITAGATIVAAIVAAITACSLKYIPYVKEESDEERKLDSNWDKLEKAVYNLYNKKIDLKCEINAKTEKKRKREWEDWCVEVNDILNKGSILAEKYEKAKKRRCTMCPLPSHARLSKEMENLTKDIVDLEKKMNIGEALMDREAITPVTMQSEMKEELSWLSKEARNLMNQLTGKNALQNIGIYGKAGIGKTTIMRCLEDTAKNSNLFQDVIFVSFEGEDNEENILKHLRPIPNNISRAPKKDYLLLVDRVTRKIDMEKLGILEDQRNWKVVIATRYRALCDSMGFKYTVEIKELPADDAARLFLQVTDGKYDSDYNLAMQIVEKHCGRMPRMIKTLATLLKGKVDWLQIEDDLEKFQIEDDLEKLQIENDLEKLQIEDHYGDNMYYVFRVIYEKLNDRAKSCYVYVALYPPYKEIYEDHLVECWLAEQYISDKQMFKKAREEGKILIKHLLDTCLLEKGTKVNCVTMPEMFRKWSLRTENGSLLKIGFRVGSEPNSAITDTNNSTPSKRVQFNKVSTLFLRRNADEDLINILERNFVLMCHLRVLDLSDTRIKRLPPSIAKLTNLIALYLNNCRELSGLPSELGELENLEILDTCRSQIPILPYEIRDLQGLRCLRVSFQSGNQNRSKSTDIIAELYSLEEMTILFDEAWRRQWNDTLNAIIKELTSLIGFTTLRFYFPSLDRLVDFLHHSEVWNNKETRWRLQTFEFFKLIVGSFDKCHEINMSEYEVAQSLKNFEESPSQKGSSIAVSKLLRQGVELISHSTIQHLSSIGIDSMAELKVCVVKSCKEMKSVICNKDAQNMKSVKSAINDKDNNASPFSLLNQLHLMDLEKLTCLFECSMPMGSLNNLTTLTIARCNQLKAVLSIDMTLQIPHLKRLRVESCEEVSVIIERSKKFQRITEVDLLSKMETLELINLSALESIGQNILLECPSLQTIEVDRCSSLENLSLSGKNSRKPVLKCKYDWWSKLKAAIRIRFQSQACVISNQSNQPVTDRIIKNDVLTEKQAEENESQRTKNLKGTSKVSQTTSEVGDCILPKDGGLKEFKGFIAREGSKMQLTMELDMSAMVAEISSSIKAAALSIYQDLQFKMTAETSNSEQEFLVGNNGSNVRSNKAAIQYGDKQLPEPSSPEPRGNNEIKSSNSMSLGNRDEKYPTNGDHREISSVESNSRQAPPSPAPNEKKIYRRGTDVYEVIDILGDGSCLFGAIALGNYLRTTEETPNQSYQTELTKNMRGKITKMLRERRSDEEWCKNAMLETGHKNIVDYANAIDHGKIWGGDPELAMAINLLKLPIYIFEKPNGEASELTLRYRYDEYGQENPINLLRKLQPSPHYDLLKRIAKTTCT